MKGISNERACKCKDHHFLLRPLNENLHHSKKVQFSTCDPLPKNPNKKLFPSKPKCLSGFPALNTDKNHATPAFILQSEKQHFLDNRNVYLKDHARKVRQYEEMPTDIYFPVPRSNYDYCNVCCISYTDYIQHIGSFEHHRQIKMSKFNDYILDLEQEFKNKETSQGPKRSIAQRCIEIDDESDSGSWGQKKLKSEEKTELTANLGIFSQNQEPHLKNYYQFNNYIQPEPIINPVCFGNKFSTDSSMGPWNNAVQNYTSFGQLHQNQLIPLMPGCYPGQQNHCYLPESNYLNHFSPYVLAHQLNACVYGNGFVQHPLVQISIEQNPAIQLQFNQYHQGPYVYFNTVPFYPF